MISSVDCTGFCMIGASLIKELMMSGPDCIPLVVLSSGKWSYLGQAKKNQKKIFYSKKPPNP